MPAKDTYHDAVKNALIKDGWTITADPYYIAFSFGIWNWT
ncbi:element excision factor XisH family protein [Lusitaniella coriacea LEGE 07167]